MSKLLITTQIQENYGAHDWDGEGSCPQYWKMKGGNDYVILNYPLEGHEGDFQNAIKIVEAVKCVDRFEERQRSLLQGIRDRLGQRS
jgi:hypothetical protein